MGLNLFEKRERRYNAQVSWYINCADLIPCGASTISKNPARFPIGAHPIYIKRAERNQIFDLDGNEFLDWTSGLGTNILGYTNKAVTKAIRDQLEYGVNCSYPSELEYQAAEKIFSLIPTAYQIKFFKTGSDACNAAVRVARAFKKKDKKYRVLVSRSCYHGNGDWFAWTMDYHNGVPHDPTGLCFFEYNNIESVRKNFREHDDIAAVMLEPAITGQPDKAFLQELRELCNDFSALLIFDEMVTGFRSPKFSVQSHVNVYPDLSTFGKALGNGMPISVLVGRRDIMNLFNVDYSDDSDSVNPGNEVFYSGTYFGETLSLAAVIATLTELRRRDSFHPSIIGNILTTHRKNLIFNCDTERRNNYRIVPRYNNNKNNDPVLYKSVFMQELAKEGIVIGNIIYPNHAHTERQAKYTAQAICDVVESLLGKSNSQLEEMLEGSKVNDFKLRK